MFNEGKLAIYVNGVWGASLISENINAKYALLPTTSGKNLSCESACFGYVLGKSGNEQKEEASIRFLKYMLSKKVQTRILEEAGSSGFLREGNAAAVSGCFSGSKCRG